MHILEAIGVGAAAGLSPMVAIAALVIFAAASVGVQPANSDVSFVTGVAVVVIAAVLLVQSFLMILSPGGNRARIAADRPSLMPINVLFALIFGGFAGALVFSAEGEIGIIGAIIGALSGLLVALGASGLLGGVSRRLEARGENAAAKKGLEHPHAPITDPNSGRVLALGVDIATIVAVLLALAAPPLGLMLPILAALLLVGSRRRAAKKHAGLRVLR